VALLVQDVRKLGNLFGARFAAQATRVHLLDLLAVQRERIGNGLFATFVRYVVQDVQRQPIIAFREALFGFCRQGIEVAWAPDTPAQTDNFDQVITFEQREVLAYTDGADIEFLAQFGSRHLAAMSQQV
jgi:hypothetical protein